MDNTTATVRLKRNLEQALTALSDGGPDTIAVFGSPSCCYRSPSGPPKGLFRVGLQSHACTEIAFAVSGPCRLWGPRGYLPLPTNRLVVIPPDTPHCEGWESADTPYRLVWMAVIGDDVHVFADSFSAENGWHMEASVFLDNAGGRALSQAVVSAAERTTAAAAFLLQGNLLAVLARLFDAAVNEDTTLGGNRRHGVVAQVKSYLDLHYADCITVSSVAALFRLSPNHLNGIFSKHEGVGMYEYLLQRRLQKADQLLRSTDLLVKQVAYEVGFADPLYFSRLYRKRFGYPPSAQR